MDLLKHYAPSPVSPRMNRKYRELGPLNIEKLVNEKKLIISLTDERNMEPEEK